MIITYPLNGISYTAEDAESYLCTRTSGVFSSENHFAVSVTGDREVTISSGLAWINNGDYTGKSVLNTGDVALTVPVSDGTLDRIDRVVLRFDKAANRSDLMLLTGTPASTPSAPAISRTELLYDLALYDIRVPAASVYVESGNISSNMLNEALCGIMRDGVTGIPTAQLQRQVEALLAAMQSESEALLSDVQANADALFAELRNEIAGVKDSTGFLFRSGGEMTGTLQVGSDASANDVRMLIERLGTDQAARILHEYINNSGEATFELTKNGVQANALYIGETETRSVQPIAFAGGADGVVAKQSRENLGVLIADEITDGSGQVVTENAVVGYAAPLTMFVLTNVDPGAGSASPYPDGTRVDVYE